MAVMTQDQASGEREFVVPFEHPPGGPFPTARAELVIAVGRLSSARRVAVRYYPTQLEFQTRLFDLVKQTPFEARAGELSLAAAMGEPVVTFEGDVSVTTLLPFKLEDLAALDAFLATQPPLMRQEAYKLASVEVRPVSAADASP